MTNSASEKGSFVVFVMVFLCGAIPAFSHHGTAASYDMSKSVTLTGVVTEYVFTNPHAQLYIDVKDTSGEALHWGCELNSPGNLRRDGWNKQTFKAGDQVTLSMNPSKAGTQYGVVDRSKPVSVNGKELPGRSSNVD